MSEFDPYHKWLGITPDEQPVNHYRLLGIRLFESDADVIANAADRQMAHIKTQATGQYVEQSQTLLNALAAARVCLLKPVAKVRYDVQLKVQIAEVTPIPTPEPVAAPRRKRQRHVSLVPIVTPVVGIICVIVTFVLHRVYEPVTQETVVTPADAPVEATPAKPVEVTRPKPAIVQPKPAAPPVVEPAPVPVTPPPPTEEVKAVVTESPDTNAFDIEEVDVPSPQPVVKHEPTRRIPVPSDVEQRAAKQALAELLNESPEKLLALANESEGDAASQYVLLDMVKTSAVKTGDVALAGKAVDAAAKRFEIEPHAAKAEALGRFLRDRQGLKNPQTQLQLISQAIEASQQALRDEQFEPATKLAQIGNSAAQASKLREIMKRASATVAGVKVAQKAHAAQAAAMSTLKDDPDNAEANLAVGRYLCFIRGDWTAGLPYLAKCANEALQTAAKRELVEPTSPQLLVQCGDLWWAAAEKANAQDKDYAQARAINRYQLVLADLKGLERMRVEKRLQEFLTDRAVLPLDVLLQAKGVAGISAEKWLANGKVLKLSGDSDSITVPAALPPIYEVVMNVRRPKRGDGHLAIQFVAGTHVVNCEFDGIEHGQRVCQIKIDQKVVQLKTEAFRTDRPYEVRILVGVRGVLVMVNAKQLIAMEMPTDKPADDPSQQVEVSVRKGTYEIGRLQILPVKG